MRGKDVAAGLEIAERISGDTAVGHGLAYCLAVEDARRVVVPEDAQLLRSVLLELERLYNHVADIGGLCNDVGFGLAQAWALTLREQLLHLNGAVTGHRLLRGGVVPGGARLLRLPTGAELGEIGQRFEELVELVMSSALVMERFTGTAILDEAHGRDLGVIGVVGRASGLAFDARVAHRLVEIRDRFSPTVHSGGDVMARFCVRVDEVRSSLSLLTDFIGRIDALDVVTWIKDRSDGQPSDGGVGIAEGWRGAVVHRVELDEAGRLVRVKVVDPSFLNWPALPVCLTDTIVPDFPLAEQELQPLLCGERPLMVVNCQIHQLIKLEGIEPGDRHHSSSRHLLPGGARP